MSNGSSLLTPIRPYTPIWTPDSYTPIWKVYGVAVPIGGGNLNSNSQHHGFGRKLMAKAEEIVRQKGWKKIADISGIGVREYYRKLDYNLEGTYMVKHLN